MIRKGRCMCGLKLTHHFTATNRKLSCDDARKLHPRAHVRGNFHAQLIESLTFRLVKGTQS